MVGDGLEQGTQMGPLQNKKQFDKVLGFIETRGSDGKIIAGGGAQGDKGYFINPTIVRDIADGSKLVDEEQFGPVMPVIKYTDADDAVRRANASTMAWAARSGRQHRAGLGPRGAHGRRLGVGEQARRPGPDLPFGGAKFSGIGVELGEEGLKEFTQVQVLNMAR